MSNERLGDDDSGRPGAPAPHVPLRNGDTELSTSDLFGQTWVLLTGGEGGVWHQAAARVADRLGLTIRTYGLGPELTDPTGQLTELYGIQNGGASLVRPDGIIAWRSGYEVRDAVGTLTGVLNSVTDLPAA